jgi:hypothetical protein
VVYFRERRPSLQGLLISKEALPMPRCWPMLVGVILLTACIPQQVSREDSVTTGTVDKPLPAAALTPLPQHGSGPLPLTMSSLDSPFAMAGTLDGAYHVLRETIIITVTKLHLFNRDTAPYKGRSHVERVSMGLGITIDFGVWDIIQESNLHTVEQTTWPGDELILRDIVFTINRENIPDLSPHWLVLRIRDHNLDDPRRDIPYSESYIHSSRTIFR